ncbi:MAG: [FeFe] hydrogenase H-cluster radical SAM maturase HydE [Candidatus Omnitrophica bacterium]|nr:[FeFe] hydrogenase H-cluster radical SAM maturase HydE [Candidatus Omnitrophota bacterium]MDD5546143.1 [FeFe] hydrogenase H-cluster radical SAM maturase HydE [Candidatus Omnitrophota bacterium]
MSNNYGDSLSYGNSNAEDIINYGNKYTVTEILSLEDEKPLRELYDLADGVRKKYAGDAILLRGLVEFSNYCAKSCYYCGLNASNKSLERYRLTKEEILNSVSQIAACKIKTVVLQSGEDPALKPEWLAALIKEIKSRYDIAVTLSVGERPREDYKLWKDAGADRYLLKIETSDKKLYDSLHCGMDFEDRLRCLRDLKGLGYETGSGIMVGLPGQTLRSIAADILFFKEWDFDMIGIGPFIPHGKTPLADNTAGDVNLVLKTLALTRIVTKRANLPATTALGSLSKDFRVEGLKAGANVLMPNFTPAPYKKLYEIYPNKRCISESAGSCAPCMESLAASIGRTIA